jgi:type IV secretory pathway TraG/TraD family ATPase VirD4
MTNAFSITFDRCARSLRDRFSHTPEWPEHFAGAYLGMGARDPVFTGPEHSALVIGPPRSGKTSSVIVPALTMWNGPAVATSTKPDALWATGTPRLRSGQVWVFDPTGSVPVPARAMPLHWSPLLGCADWQTAIDRAWMLTHTARPNPSADGVHWTERAAALLAPLLHAAALQGRTMTTLLEWIHLRETWHALDVLGAYPAATVAHHLLSGISQTDSRELSGIWSTSDGVLAAYRNPATLHGADHPNFDPAAFVRSSDTVHIVSPSARTGPHVPAICAFLDHMRSVALQCPGRLPMLWALDEMVNIAPLPNLPGIVADAGSQGLLLLACLQDLSQARHRWGPQADGFLTLFSTTLLLPGVADTPTLHAVSTLAGKVDRPHHSTTRTSLLSAQRTVTTRQEPLLPESVIAHGKPGHALHLRTTQPSWLRLTPWHSTPGMASSFAKGSL